MDSFFRYSYIAFGIYCSEPASCKPHTCTFPGEQKEEELVGTTSIEIEDIVKDIKSIFMNPEKFNKSREVAKKYYTWDRIIERNVVIYNRLLSKYK